jgi:hypothetical protein
MGLTMVNYHVLFMMSLVARLMVIPLVLRLHEPRNTTRT